MNNRPVATARMSQTTDERRCDEETSYMGLSLRFVSALLLFPLTASARDSLKLPTPTSDERIEYIRRARVREPTDVASKDLYNGPEGKLKFGVDQEIPLPSFAGFPVTWLVLAVAIGRRFERLS